MLNDVSNFVFDIVYDFGIRRTRVCGDNALAFESI